MIERMWMLAYGHWESNWNGRDEYVEDIDTEEGFFLLEADALARADQLNTSTRQRYIADCEQQKKTYQQELAEHDELARKNALLVANGFEPLPAKREPTEPKTRTYEQWVEYKQEATYVAIEIAPGAVR